MTVTLDTPGMALNELLARIEPVSTEQFEALLDVLPHAIETRRQTEPADCAKVSG